MPRKSPNRSEPLTIETIVEVTRALIADAGLGALSMRSLGAQLGVDPMAVYHHVPNKRELLSLVTAQVVATMPMPVAADRWDERVRAWATAYWDVVVANRELVAAGLADPVVAAGGVPHTAPLTDAVAASGIPSDLVEPNTWLVVDFVHGAALAAGAPLRHAAADLDPLREAFGVGIDTVVAGIRAQTRRRGR